MKIFKIPKMRRVEVFLILWVLSEVSLSHPAPITAVDQLPHVRGVQENVNCLHDSSKGKKCPAGYHVGEDPSARECHLCQPNTFQPGYSACKKCILCSECDDGYHVGTACSPIKDTICVESATVLPTTEAATQASTVADFTTWQPTDLVTQEYLLCTRLRPPVFHYSVSARSLWLYWELPDSLDRWYTILYSTANTNATHEEHTTRTGEHQWTIEDLEPHTVYRVQIRAHSWNCSSAFTSPIYVKTDDKAPFFFPYSLNIVMYFLNPFLVLIVALLTVQRFNYLRYTRRTIELASQTDKASSPVDQPLLDQPPDPDNGGESVPPQEETTV